ncbi:DsbA family oxidoreductase [Xanthomonas maliensis]|uniref:DsbA family oxidoreductase n=1 Tax=Xanthomonas maliensis TaxID=1321368 RepID=UPI00039A4CC5|nr:DsbA family oxidoreductase [Xanthomonas maliensis]KAB7765964.1 DsbA family oxidoreductase [Xanthomonas maliensis]
MRIDLWSDLACPWCWIGKHRLAQAIALLGAQAPALEIHYHPFQLEPDAGLEPVPLREALARKFGGAERVGTMLAQTQATARAEGLPFDFDRGQVHVNTRRAHRLLWLAAREGDVEAVAEALFHAHFAEGRNLAALDTLIAAGAAGGVDQARVRALFDGQDGISEVEAELAQAAALGIQAVPSFVIDGRHLVQGAQPPEALARALLQLSQASAGTDAAACGPDACAH